MHQKFYDTSKLIFFLFFLFVYSIETDQILYYTVRESFSRESVWKEEKETMYFATRIVSSLEKVFC